MIKNFHFKMLIGLALYSFVMSAIFIAAGFRSNSHELSIPIGGVFSAIGLFAIITAGAIKSISYRLDKASIAEDPKFPTSGGNAENKKGIQGRDGDAEESV